MGLYQENKNFVNKYKQALISEMKKRSGGTRRLQVFINPKDFCINMLLNTKVNPEVYIVEAGKKLYFCVKSMIVDRKVTPDYYSDGFQTDNISEMAIEIFADNLVIYNDDILEELRKQILSNGHMRLDGKDIKDVDTRTLYYIVRNKPLVIKGYSGLKAIEDAIKELQTCPFDVYRHPDVFKSIKDRELIPVSYLEEDGKLTYPYTRARSRKSTSFYQKSSYESIMSINTKGLIAVAKKAIGYTPFNMWCVYMPKSGIINESTTFNANYNN